MLNFSKKIGIFAIVAMTVFSGVSFAAENSERSLTGFLRNLFHYPARATQETAGMASNTLNNTGEKVVSRAGENTAGILQGDVSRTGNLAGDAITGTADTVGQTASETVQIPVRAAEEQPTKY